MFIAIGSSGQVASSKGSIRGKVVDDGGSPVVGAKVHAELHGAPMGKAIRFVETDGVGSFIIEQLDFGTYDVNGGKEEDGYPQTDWSLYADRPAAAAILTIEKPVADVVLKFGPKAAVIMGSVRDAVTGKPLNSTFKLSRDESRWISTSAPPEFRFLIPSNTAIDVEVSASGYKRWRYDEAFPDSRLALPSASETRLEIQLTAAPCDSKPSRLLVPSGYVGWVLLESGVSGAPPAAEESDANIFKFPNNGRLKTSTSGPVEGADTAYFYYSADDSLTAISSDYRNGNGMIWGEYSAYAHGQRCMFGFFVGGREEYEKRKNESQIGVSKPCQ